MRYHFKAMTADDARDMLRWRYEGEYSLYNITPADYEQEVAFLCDPLNQYFAIYQNDTFIGHVVFGAEGRVAGGDYRADALDIGIGMRPDTTGQGKGTQIIKAVLDFARVHYQPKNFRATIIAWNKRSQKATTNNGFKESSRFKKTGTRQAFIIFTREA